MVTGNSTDNNTLIAQSSNNSNNSAPKLLNGSNNNRSNNSNNSNSHNNNNNTNNSNNNNTNNNNTGCCRTSWNIKTTRLAKRTINRIRGIVETIKIEPNPTKPMIPLSIGDPTTFGNLKAADETMKAVRDALDNAKCNGYAHSQGCETARQAIAKYSAHQSSEEIKPEHIFITSGCSSALEYSILALVERGQNILLPRPGFCLYQTLADGMDIEVRYYDLLPEKQWQTDLQQMESLIDDNTAALLINNPSNPCGSVFSREHLQDILAICEKYYLPIIADEIYEHFVFPGVHHIAVSSLSRNVPVLSCGGLTKRFLVPGWRLGWIIVHDRQNRLADVIIGLKNMCGRILGSNTVIQAAIPDILECTPQSYFDSVIAILHENANLTYNKLRQIRGLNPIMPRGAMYIMVGINIDQFPEFKDDLNFVQELVKEQSVFCLPGSCFEYPNFIRIVLTVPYDMLEEACSRIAEFCETHYKVDQHIIESNLLSEVY